MAKHLVIVGGGFAGASMAVQTARYSPYPLQITIVEPAAQLGRGLAYGTDDPDHRVNGPFYTHSIDPLVTGHGDDWAARVGLLRDDPQAQWDTGIFPRRRDYARYLADSVAEHAQRNPSGSTITHQRDRVTRLKPLTSGWQLSLAAGGSLKADEVVLAFGNPEPRLPASLRPWSEHPAMIGSPWQQADLHAISPQASVVIMGSSLTAIDVLATLVRQQHQGPITVFSRRGLAPRPQRPAEPPPSEPPPASWLVDRINGPVAGFLTKTLRREPTARALLRAVRQEIDRVTAAGAAWQVGFDELRDVLWQVWPRIPVQEQQRILRRLRPWYDVHRFRLSPPTYAVVSPAEESGQVRHLAARLQEIRAIDGRQLELSLQLASTPANEPTRVQCDALINCTGLDITAAPAPGSLAASLLDDGLLTRHPTGLGYRVDDQNRVLGADQTPLAGLRLIGPATAGCFGDPLGAMFIAVQIYRFLPQMLAAHNKP